MCKAETPLVTKVIIEDLEDRQPIFKYLCIVNKPRLASCWQKTEQECIVYIIRRKHCRAVHKDFKDFLSSARLWSPKRGSAAVRQPCSRALPFVSFVPNSLSCHPGFHPCHPGFIWTATLPLRFPSLLPCHPSSHPFSCKHLADLVFTSKSVLFDPS